MSKEIEIPFGAKDSELKNWEYTIPENMEAEIKDGKIIVKQKENEEERIRKDLITFICQFAPEHLKVQYVAYLEKQKEPHYTKRNALFDKCVENCDPETVEEVNKRVDDIMNMPELSAFEQALTNFIGYWEDDEERWPSKFVKKHSKHILDMAREELQKEQIPYIDFVIKPHKGDDSNPYDMRVSEAQEYAIKRGFDIPLNDCEVYVDERHMTQTIGNILRWADEHPKEQKPTAEGVLIRAGLKAFKDGNQWCILVGDNIQEGVCGFGDTIEDSLYEFLKEVLDLQKEQKPAEWSKEDEIRRESCMQYLANTRDGIEFSQHIGDNAKESGKKEIQKDIDWLKSLPERFNLQPKQGYSEEDIKKIRSEEYTKGFNDAAFGGKLKEWNAEDEDRIRQIERIAQEAGCTQKLQEEIHDWLKSLRPQHHWKPSEEQINALGRAIVKAHTPFDIGILAVLRDNLKKLMI